VNAIASIDLIVRRRRTDDTITARAPYDLLIANILAAHSSRWRRRSAAIAAPGATIVLAGLLENSAPTWSRPLRRVNCTLAEVDRAATGRSFG